jgi:hypothetical protein
MITHPLRRETLFIYAGLIFVLLLTCIPGCTKRIQTGTTGGEGPAPIVTTREFPDVPIPKDLALDQEESFVYMAPDLAAGLLVYNGNVDYDSLVRFFEESLTKNGWLLRASLKYPKTFLFYQKETRVCLITLEPQTLNLLVKIWVAPLETLTYEHIMSE